MTVPQPSEYARRAVLAGMCEIFLLSRIRPMNTDFFAWSMPPTKNYAMPNILGGARAREQRTDGR